VLSRPWLWSIVRLEEDREPVRRSRGQIPERCRQGNISMSVPTAARSRRAMLSRR